MVRIKITKAEIAAQSLTDEHLQSALVGMDRDGVVVLENAIPLDIVDRLGDKMRDDMAAVKKVRSIAEKSSNESLAPPLNHPWVFREICYNEFAIQVTEALLGDGIYWNFYSSNSVQANEMLEGHKVQNLHADAKPLFPEPMNNHPTSAHMVAVNIPLCDFTEENGATEVWLGTHKEVRPLYGYGHENYEPLLAKWQDRAAIVQMTAPRSSVVIRDMRVYHRGMPNQTSQLRQMLAIVHAAPWLRVRNSMPFARGTEDFFQHSKLEAHCTFHDPTVFTVDWRYERDQQGLPDLCRTPGQSYGGLQI